MFSTLWRAGSSTGGPAPSLSTRPVVWRKKDIVKGSHPLASGAAAGAAAPKVLTGPDVICSGSVVPGISAGASWTGIDTMRSRGSKVSIISNGASWIGMDKRSSTSASISLISSSSKLRAALLCARFDVTLKATAALAHNNSIRYEAARKEADGGMTCVAKCCPRPPYDYFCKGGRATEIATGTCDPPILGPETNGCMHAPLSPSTRTFEPKPPIPSAKLRGANFAARVSVDETSLSRWATWAPCERSCFCCSRR